MVAYRAFRDDLPKSSRPWQNRRGFAFIRREVAEVSWAGGGGGVASAMRTEGPWTTLGVPDMIDGRTTTA